MARTALLLSSMASGGVLVCVVLVITGILLYRHYKKGDDTPAPALSPTLLPPSAEKVKVRIHECSLTLQNYQMIYPTAVKLLYDEEFFGGKFAKLCTERLNAAGYNTTGKTVGMTDGFKDGVYFDCMLNKTYRGSVLQANANLKSAQQACNKTFSNCKINKCTAVPMLSANEERPFFKPEKPWD